MEEFLVTNGYLTKDLENPEEFYCERAVAVIFASQKLLTTHC
jgi:hypothetical protein